MGLPIAYQWLADLSKMTMNQAWNKKFKGKEIQMSPTRKEPDGSTAQATYLLPRWLQKIIFLQNGYIEGTPGDYGLVKKAVGNRNLPVFQTAQDNVTRNDLAVIGNTDNMSESFYPIKDEARLLHAGSYPSALYIDAEGNLYRKDWDLNDYGQSSGGARYGSRQWKAELVDKIGSPVVVTTGFQPVYHPGIGTSVDDAKQANIYDDYESSQIIQKFIRDQGLVPFYEDAEINFGANDEQIKENLRINGQPIPTTKKITMFTLPEVVISNKQGGKLIKRKPYIK